MRTKFPLSSRRDFLKASIVGGATLAAGLWGYKKARAEKYPFDGSIVGANSKAGHLLRDGVHAEPTVTKTIDTVIVGGGIAGLSAAWWLQKKNHTNFVLLEMDQTVGGNSASGSNSISKYPWGAHYVPLPGPDAVYVREFFEEIGIIQGYEKGLPVYNEFHLCADNHERLFFQGEWQDGLVPQHGVPHSDKKQYNEFFAYVEQLKLQKGSDGKYAFNIPMELSSRDPEFLALDKVSMSDFMKSKGWDSTYLNWYVNYSCRDDYGMPHDKLSAWTGLHYFASRKGAAANADSQAIVTWPEGNGYLVEVLRNKVSTHIQTNSLAFNIENNGSVTNVDVINTIDKSCVRYIAKNVIYCGPRFTANKVIQGYTSPAKMEYAPWLVANISLKSLPQSKGTQLSWDNVSYYSKSLGYIVANHQDLKFNHKEAVFTYYLPLDDKTVKDERMSAYRRSYQDWMEIVLRDLEGMHPGITAQISQADLWIWGHGMISPGIDFLWSHERQELLKSFGNVHFAHSDMSGISIFEEAQYRGVEAAKKVLAKV